MNRPDQTAALLGMITDMLQEKGRCGFPIGASDSGHLEGVRGPLVKACGQICQCLPGVGNHHQRRTRCLDILLAAHGHSPTRDGFRNKLHSTRVGTGKSDKKRAARDLPGIKTDRLNFNPALTLHKHRADLGK